MRERTEVAHGAWSQHLGRAAYVVAAPCELVTRIAGDGHALNRLVLPLLDEDLSALSARAPRWVLPPVPHVPSDLRAGVVALVSVDHNLRSPKVLLRSEPVPEAVPTRIALDLDLEDVGYETRVTARWDVGVELPLPGVAARALGPLLGAAVERLVHALVDGLGDAALAALAEGGAPPADTPSTATTAAPPRPTTGPLPALQRDEDLERLLDEVIELG